MKARELRSFMKSIPDSAEVILSNGIITFMFGDNTLALNKYGAQWDNGVGYSHYGHCCGECSHFDCSKCREEINDD